MGGVFKGEERNRNRRRDKHLGAVKIQGKKKKKLNEIARKGDKSFKREVRNEGMQVSRER